VRTKKQKEKKGEETTITQSTRKTEIAASTVTKPETPVKTPVKAGRKISSAKAPTTPEPSKKKADVAHIVEQKENKAVPASPAKATSKTKTTGRKRYEAIPTEPSALKEVRESKDVKVKETKEVAITNTTAAPTKRQHPGKLDITAATQLTELEQSPFASSSKTDTQSRSIRAATLTSNSSVPPSPAAMSTGSPIRRSTAPRTLRVLPTPKTESAPLLPSTSAPTPPYVPTVDKLRSRQASIASINQPGTPASEFVSDTASITSTSISRANSPPPTGGRIGSAPVRKKTKSQVKKERQDRARQIQEEQLLAMEEQEKSDAEAVQAPILGRKKKAKKPAAAKPKPVPVPVPVKTMPSSPKPTKVEEEDEEEDEEEEIEVKAVPEPSSMKTALGKTSMASPRSPRKTQNSPLFESTSSPRQSKEKPQPTAQSIIADLQRTGDLLASTLEFFKPLSSSLAHASRTSQTQAISTETMPPDLKIHFSEADLDALAKKKPVRLNGQDGKPDSRTLITPQGKFFWGLTQELEEKALELEKHIEELKGSARFRPRKATAHQHTHQHHNTHMHSHNIQPHAQSKDVLPAIATALKEAGAKLSKSSGSPTQHQMPKLDPTSTVLGSSSLPLPPLQTQNGDGVSMPWLDPLKPPNKPFDLSNLPPVSNHQAMRSPSPPPQQSPADAIAYLNQFVIPKTDNQAPNVTRTEMAAVGGPPGAGASCQNINMNLGLNGQVSVGKIAKAARAVADGSLLAGEFGGLGGGMKRDELGGVVVQGLEALVGAGLGLGVASHDFRFDDEGAPEWGMEGMGDMCYDSHGQVAGYSSMGRGYDGMAAMYDGGAVKGTGRRSVLTVEEAEMAMLAAKKDQESLEKRLAGTMKRNKKMVGGVGR
jgi:hypothetical protein